MSLATTIATFNTASPFALILGDSPQAGLGGSVVQGTSGGAGGSPTVRRLLMAFHMQGGGASECKLWLDSDIADVYPLDGSTPTLRVSLASLSVHVVTYILGYSPSIYPTSEFPSLAIPGGNITAFQDNTLASWTNIPTTAGTALDLGAAPMSDQVNAYSQMVGVALKIPSGFAPSHVSGLRFSWQFTAAPL